MSEQRQRQRQGARKHLAAGIGGLVVGTALVLFLRNRMRSRRKPATPAALPGAGPGEQEAEA